MSEVRTLMNVLVPLILNIVKGSNLQNILKQIVIVRGYPKKNKDVAPRFSALQQEPVFSLSEEQLVSSRDRYEVPTTRRLY